METDNFLSQVHEGMKVFDRLHHQIGIVDHVQMSDDSIDADELEPHEQGFLHIDSKGLRAADRYVLPDEIMSVSGEAVVLTMSHDELMRKH